MSAVDRVVNYMTGLPQSAEHAKTYASEFMERVAKSDIVVVNGVEEEKRMLSKGEKAILARLDCPDKFTRKDFASQVRLNAGVTLQGKEFVRQDTPVDLDFLGSHHWLLEPANSRALYSAKESTIHLLDAAQKRSIMARCPNIAGNEAIDVHMLSVHEKMSVPSDMRHMLMKMYLILCDYNLAVTSKSEQVDTAEGMRFRMMEHISDIDRLAAVVAHDVVIDADAFTSTELGLLGLAAQPYPSIWYTVENMYSKCQMEADDLMLVSSGDIHIDTSFLWGSPDRLLQMIMDISAKLNCMGDFIAAFSNMRGKCKMVADIVKNSECRSINSMVPLSYSMTHSFGGAVSNYVVTNAAGYFSTSVSLVADLLYGMTFEASSSCVIESLGGCGKLLSSANPPTSTIANGLLRDYGLQHTSSEDNILIRNWEIMAGRPLTWDFGPYLKSYLLNLASKIVNGIDIPLPQILHAIPALTAVNTCYGLARGWRGPPPDRLSSKKERADESDALASISWSMGMRPTRPMVFFNRVGKKPQNLTNDEYFLQGQSKGVLGLGDVRFMLADTLGGRVDENEEVAGSLYRTEYAGTKCSMVFNTEIEEWELEQIGDPPGRQSMRLDPPNEDLVPEVGVLKTSGMRSFNWGAPRQFNNDDKFKALANLSRPNQIVPSHKPRHVRVNSAGGVAVQSYVLNDSPTSVLRTPKRHEYKDGGSVKFGKISVPGDGSCGIHAIVEDLKSHGMIGLGDVKRATDMFSDEALSKSFHETQELAALAQTWGMNLDVLDEESGIMNRFGNTPDAHTISIARSGLHFSPMVVGEEGHEVSLRKVDQQECAPDEYLTNFKNTFGNLFGKPNN